MTYPSQIEDVGEDWYNAWGLTYSADRDVVVWQTGVTDINSFQYWNNVSRTLVEEGVYDPLNYGDIVTDIVTFGVASDGNIYFPTQTAFPDFQPYIVGVPPAGGTGTALLTSEDPPVMDELVSRCKVVQSGSSELLIGLSNAFDLGYWVYNLTSPTVLMKASSDYQIKEVIQGPDNTVYFIGTYGPLAVNEISINGTVVEVSGVQNSGIGSAYGFYSNGALIIVTGAAPNSYICRIDLDTMEETHAILASDTELPGREGLLGQNAMNAPFFIIYNKKYSSADLSLIQTYDFADWDLESLGPAMAIYDVQNDAIFFTDDGPPSDQRVGWLFLPTRKRATVHVRYGDASLG